MNRQTTTDTSDHEISSCTKCSGELKTALQIRMTAERWHKMVIVELIAIADIFIDPFSHARVGKTL